jgi:hypothetical protein
MNNLFLTNLWRFVAMLAFQVLVLSQLSSSIGQYFNVLVYPLFILLLPLSLPTSGMVAAGFLMGIALDLILISPGVHASAGAFSGWIRTFLLKVFESKGGFSGKELIVSPAWFGQQTYLQVSGLLFFLHIFWYFAMEQFNLVDFGTIVLKTLAAWPLSMIFVVLYGYLFNPKS